MNVLDHFDAAVAPPFRIEDSDPALVFDLNARASILHVRLCGVPAGLHIRLQLDEKKARFLEGQGLFASRDGLRYEPLGVRRNEAGELCVALAEPGDWWIASRAPYGRDALDRLLADCVGAEGLKIRTACEEGRSFPIFEFERAQAGRPVHWIVAGEDCWETAGCWTADAIVRELASGSGVARELRSRAAVRVVPLVSPFSATRGHGSYTTPEGTGCYGAATWGDETPPPEFRALRAAVVEDIRARRLGLMLAIHSWQAQQPYSGMEFIRTAGANTVEGARLQWANETMQALVKDVPKAKAAASEKIWHPGLARDYLLSAHGAIGFRIEITTAGQAHDGFRRSGLGLLAGLASVSDWSAVLPCGPGREGRLESIE